MRRRHRLRIAFVCRQHVGVIGVPDSAGRDVGKHVLPAQRGKRLSAIDEPAADRITAARQVRILNHRVGRRDGAVGDGVGDANGNPVFVRQGGRGVVGLQRLISLAQRVSVVRALVNDVDGFPRVQPDRVRDQAIVACVCGIDRPVQAMRIAQARRPDLLPRAGYKHERIVVRDPVASVLARRAGRLVFPRVRDDAQNFADERIEPLRVHANAQPRLTGSAVAAPDIEDAPLGIPTAGRRIEREIAQRMNACVELHAHQLARGAFERRVRRLRIGPLDEDAFALNGTRRRDQGRRRIPAHIQSGNVRVVRQVRTRQRRILHVNRVERSVPRIIRIELKADEAAREAGFECELVEEARASVAAVEVEIGRECPAGFVEDVQRTVQVVHEQPV